MGTNPVYNYCVVLRDLSIWPICKMCCSIFTLRMHNLQISGLNWNLARPNFNPDPYRDPDRNTNPNPNRTAHFANCADSQIARKHFLFV